MIGPNLNYNDINYAYRTVSVDHFPALQENIDYLNRLNQISQHAVFQKYIRNKHFILPDDFSNAKYIIILAQRKKIAVINVHYQQKIHHILIPPNYYFDDITSDTLLDLVRHEIVSDLKYRVYSTRTFHLKLLAVRSGLGRYGRNNICYVDGMGSFFTLHTYLTDFPFDHDDWTDLHMMDLCHHCRLCMDLCPTGSIREDPFVIDVDRCLPLYNEIPGLFPSWVTPTMHSALEGCLICQRSCPANREVIKQTVQFEDITEEETVKLLRGDKESEFAASIARKTKMFDNSDANYFLPVLQRNLSVLLANPPSSSNNRRNFGFSI